MKRLTIVILLVLSMAITAACVEQDVNTNLGRVVYARGELLYYMDALDVMQYNISSKIITVVAEEVESAAFFGDHIFYIEHSSRTFSIYEQSLVTGERKLVRGGGLSEPTLEEVVMCDKVIELCGELYYSTRYPARLFKYGDTDELITDFSEVDVDTLQDLHTDGNKLYCAFYHDRNNCLYVYDPATSDGKFFVNTNPS